MLRDRAVGRIAMVDEQSNTVFDEYVKPDVPVYSCLTALTGAIIVILYTLYT